MIALIKTSAKQSKKERDVGFLDTQKAYMRASRRSDEGPGKYLAKSDWVKGRLKDYGKGALVAGLAGGAIGRGVGRKYTASGALIGAGLGALANLQLGEGRRLTDAGIKTRFGLKSKMDEDTYKKYVGNYEKK